MLPDMSNRWTFGTQGEEHRHGGYWASFLPLQYIISGLEVISLPLVRCVISITKLIFMVNARCSMVVSTLREIDTERWHHIWRIWMCFLSIISLIFTPFEVAFLKGLPEPIHIPEYMVQVMFVIDSVIFPMALKAKHIFTRWFIFFLLFFSSVPWDPVFEVFGWRGLVRLLLLLRLVRLIHVFFVFDWLEKRIPRKCYRIFQIIGLVVAPFYVVHLYACLLYYLAEIYQSDDTWIGTLKPHSDFRNSRDLFKDYITATYWAAVIYTTVGFGDIHAVNNLEMITLTITTIFNAFFQAYLMACMNVLLVCQDILGTEGSSQPEGVGTNTNTTSEGIEDQPMIQNAQRHLCNSVQIFRLEAPRPGIPHAAPTTDNVDPHQPNLVGWHPSARYAEQQMTIHSHYSWWVPDARENGGLRLLQQTTNSDNHLGIPIPYDYVHVSHYHDLHRMVSSLHELALDYSRTVMNQEDIITDLNKLLDDLFLSEMEDEIRLILLSSKVREILHAPE